MNWKTFYAMLSRDGHVARRNLFPMLLQNLLQPLGPRCPNSRCPNSLESRRKMVYIFAVRCRWLASGKGVHNAKD